MRINWITTQEIKQKKGECKLDHLLKFNRCLTADVLKELECQHLNIQIPIQNQFIFLKLFVMKNTILLLMVTSWIFIGASCSKSGNVDTPPVIIPPPPPAGTATLTVNLSQSQIAADGFDETTVTVKDANNTDVTNGSTIIVNNATINGNKFFTAVAGNYEVRATRGTAASATITLTATSPGASLFTQKTIAESFSGTWCGICPGTIIPLENYTNTHPNTISIGVHGPSGSSDPFQYIFDPQLRAAFGVTGVPTVLLNRDSKWNGNTTSLDELVQKRAALGIGIETNITGSTINVKTKVKFDVSTSIPLKIVVLLVEDNIQYNQANYGHFGLPNPIVNFNHRNVLRTAATDIFGDAIPIAQQQKGNTWEKSYTINTGSYVQSNCRIIAFVQYGDNANNRKGILNAQIVTAGQNKNFD